MTWTRSSILKPMGEVSVLASQATIEQFGDRIERAYRRRYPCWKSVGMTPGVWNSAAFRLMESAAIEPTVPVDPELFVAVQPLNRLHPDPWAELTQETSLQHYLQALKRIVGQLREELIREIRRAEKRILRGMTLDQLVELGASGISPLTLYILAHRAGRLDLSARLATEVEGQHRSCPLYLPASRSLLPVHAYPRGSSVPKTVESDQFSFSIN